MKEKLNGKSSEEGSSEPSEGANKEDRQAPSEAVSESQGLLSEDFSESLGGLAIDAEEMEIGVGHDDNKVLMRFDRPVRWFSMHPMLAMAIASQLITEAQKAASVIVVPDSVKRRQEAEIMSPLPGIPRGRN